jgi:hypothetical protein
VAWGGGAKMPKQIAKCVDDGILQSEYSIFVTVIHLDIFLVFSDAVIASKV